MKESIVVHIGGEEVKTSDPMTPEMKTIFEHLARPLSLAFASPIKRSCHLVIGGLIPRF